MPQFSFIARCLPGCSPSSSCWRGHRHPQAAHLPLPSVAPVSVTLYATYPGATPQTLNDAVVSLIERELSGSRTCSTSSHR